MTTDKKENEVTGVNLKIFGGTPAHVAREYSEWTGAKLRKVFSSEQISTMDEIFLVVVFENV